MGVDITFIGTFGDVVIWGGVTEQYTPKGKKATILTLTDPRSAADVINAYTQRFGFQLAIGFMDCFGLEFLNDIKIPVIGYLPIDGPWTAKMSNYVRNFYKIIAYSKFGYQELLKWYSPSKVGFIPHGVDVEKFKPLNEDEYDEAREWLSDVGNFAPPIPKDAFLAVSMGANIGPRKLICLLMRTWSRFAERHDDAHLLLFTNPYAPVRGYDLVSLRSELGMTEKIHFPKYDPILQPASDEELRRIFGSADIYIQNSCAEGYCLPLVEAMACGVPPIAPANSALTEHVMDNGWLVENIDPDDYIEFPVYVPTLQQYKVPSQRSLLEKFEEAYNSPDLREKYGRKSRRFVVCNYSWKRVLPQWIDLLKRTEEELELFKEIREVLRAPTQ